MKEEFQFVYEIIPTEQTELSDELTKKLEHSYEMLIDFYHKKTGLNQS